MISKPIIQLSFALMTTSIFVTGDYLTRPNPARANVRRVASCRPNDALAPTLVRDLRHMVSDTNFHARSNRLRAGLPQGTPSTPIFRVADEALCAVLQAKFARVATARDTLVPYPILAVAISPTHYVVTDVLPVGSAMEYFPDSVVYHPEQGWMETVTMTVALDSVFRWRYNHLGPLGNNANTAR